MGLLLVNAATTLLVFFIGRRLLGEFAATAAATAFALLSVDRWVMGVFAHATHFVLLPALAGLLLLVQATAADSRFRYLWAGALLGTAVLMKQHAIFFLPLGVTLVLWPDLWRKPRDLLAAGRKVALFAAGVAMPAILLILVLAAQGLLGRFWFWTFAYAKEYVSELSVSDAPRELLFGLQQVTFATLPFWLVAGVGVIALGVGRWTPEVRIFLSSLLAASLLAICPGFYFREHYFILLLPSVALLLGVAVMFFERFATRVASPRSAHMLSAALLAALAAYYVATEREYLFSMTAIDLSRTRYGQTPFVASIDVGRYIKERTTREDHIAVLGSEPEIYFYADRTSASGYLYAYPLMEPQKYSSKMQDEMIQQIEAAHPKYLVFVRDRRSWLVRPQSDKQILTWERIAIRKNAMMLLGSLYLR